MAAILIFLAVYAVLAIGHLPGFRVDRTGACIIGASLMIAFGVLDLNEAYAAIDYGTIILLFGVMIVVANLRLSGFFSAVAEFVVEHALRPILLLAAIVFVAGFFSAFFVNDTMCLVLTPLVLEITRQLRRNPVPYLLAIAMAANAGSVATITGNPQNMMIGSFSGIPYRSFAAVLSPVAAASLVLTVAVIAAAYHREFRLQERVAIERRPIRVNRPLFWKSLAASAGMLVFFLLAGRFRRYVDRGSGATGYSPGETRKDLPRNRLVAAGSLHRPVYCCRRIEKTSVPADLFRAAQPYHLERISVLSATAAILSNIVSNVPAVLVFKPFVAQMGNPARTWLTLAMSTTLAGNLTILGSVANLIVIQKARHAVRIGFWEYFRVGAPLAVLTIAVGVLVLS